MESTSPLFDSAEENEHYGLGGFLRRAHRSEWTRTRLCTSANNISLATTTMTSTATTPITTYGSGTPTALAEAILATPQAKTRHPSAVNKPTSKKRTHNGQIKQSQTQTRDCTILNPREMEVDSIESESPRRVHNRLGHVAAELHKEIEFVKMRQRMDESRKACLGGSRRSLNEKTSLSPHSDRDMFLRWREEVLR